MSEKMSPKDALVKIYQELTGQNVDWQSMFYHGDVLWCAKYCPSQEGWFGVSAELKRTMEGVVSFQIYWAPERLYQTSKYSIFTITRYAINCEVRVGPDQSLGGISGVDPGHWLSVVCAEVMIEYYKLVNGLDNVQPTRDEQVVGELANSAQRPDLTPNFNGHRTC